MAVSLHHYYATLKTTVEPAIEPVTVVEALAYAQYEGSDTPSSDLMTSLIKTARRKVEHDASVALITQTRVAKFDRFPCDIQEIHVVPVQTVAITYLDSAGAAQTLGASFYQTDIHNTPPRVAPAWGQTWPVTASGTFGSVTLTIVCGYGTLASSVPEEAKTAIKLLCREWFWNRCPTGEVGDSISMAYGSLINTLSWRPSL